MKSGQKLSFSSSETVCARCCYHSSLSLLFCWPASRSRFPHRTRGSVPAQILQWSTITSLPSKSLVREQPYFRNFECAFDQPCVGRNNTVKESYPFAISRRYCPAPGLLYGSALPIGSVLPCECRQKKCHSFPELRGPTWFAPVLDLCLERGQDRNTRGIPLPVSSAGRTACQRLARAQVQQDLPWFWNGNTTTGQILNAMAPAIEQSYYPNFDGGYICGRELCAV